MERKAFMFDMVLSELEDAVGAENVSTREADKIVYGVDYFWVSRMWADKGQLPPEADYIVRPASAEEVSKVLKIANYYKIPVHTWGGDSGSVTEDKRVLQLNAPLSILSTLSGIT